jgi:hypothetical protein
MAMILKLVYKQKQNNYVHEKKKYRKTMQKYTTHKTAKHTKQEKLTTTIKKHRQQTTQSK